MNNACYSRRRTTPYIYIYIYIADRDAVLMWKRELRCHFKFRKTVAIFFLFTITTFWKHDVKNAVTESQDGGGRHFRIRKASAVICWLSNQLSRPPSWILKNRCDSNDLRQMLRWCSRNYHITMCTSHVNDGLYADAVGLLNRMQKYIESYSIDYNGWQAISLGVWNFCSLTFKHSTFAP